TRHFLLCNMPVLWPLFLRYRYTFGSYLHLKSHAFHLSQIPSAYKNTPPAVQVRPVHPVDSLSRDPSLKAASTVHTLLAIPYFFLLVQVHKPMQNGYSKPKIIYLLSINIKLSLSPLKISIMYIDYFRN